MMNGHVHGGHDADKVWREQRKREESMKKPISKPKATHFLFFKERDEMIRQVTDKYHDETRSCNRPFVERDVSSRYKAVI